MGRQQRNRHPANRLGQRRRPRAGDAPAASSNYHRGGPDPVAPAQELPTSHRPPGQDTPHQS
jgi:hypothetical protein